MFAEYFIDNLPCIFYKHYKVPLYYTIYYNKLDIYFNEKTSRLFYKPEGFLEIVFSVLFMRNNSITHITLEFIYSYLNLTLSVCISKGPNSNAMLSLSNFSLSNGLSIRFTRETSSASNPRPILALVPQP